MGIGLWRSFSTLMWIMDMCEGGEEKGMWIRCEALMGKEGGITVINNSDFPNHNFQVF
jgi:hypothetical protein